MTLRSVYVDDATGIIYAGSAVDLPDTPSVPVSSYQLSSFMVTSGAASLFTATQSGMVFFYPFFVSKAGLTYDQLAIGTSIAQSGGTTTCSLGVYSSLADLSGPNCVPGPIVSGNVTLTTAAGTLTTSVSWSPAVGMYWLAVLYRETVAPTTRATIYCVSASLAWVNPTNVATVVGSVHSRFIAATGQTALPTGSQPTLSSYNQAFCPIVGLRRSV